MKIKNFTQIVQDFASAAQASASKILDFSVGSILLAINEAVAGMGLWFQAMILQVSLLTRAATSTGNDLDTFYADFNFYRLTGSFAAGAVVFARFSPYNSAFIPVGALVQSADGTQRYQVTVDTSNAYYSSTLLGYTMPIGLSSLSVLVNAITVGTSANVAAGLVSSLVTPISGVDTVVNTSALTGGSTTESDFSFRSRFVLYILGLRQGTIAAIQASVVNLQLGLTAQVIEGSFPNGTMVPGTISVVVDDGTGTPSASVLAAAGLAVANSRAAGINAYVFAPNIVTVTASMTVYVLAGFDNPTVKGQVGQAVTSFINSLMDGAPLYYNTMVGVAQAQAGVSHITAILLNGATADVVPLPGQVIKVSTVTVG